MTANASSRAKRQAIGLLLIALAVVLSVAIVGSILVGGASAEEVTNETVTVTNGTASIDVDVTFANVSDANATADVIVTDPSGTELANESINGMTNEVVTWSHDVNDSDPAGAYGVVLEAPKGSVVGAHPEAVAASSDGGGSGFIGGNTAGPIVAVVVMVVGAFALARRADQ